jgi:hypothetical protein
MTTTACQHLSPSPTHTLAALAGQTRVLRARDNELAHATTAPTSCAVQALIAGKVIDLPITSSSAFAAGKTALKSP